MDRDVAIKQLLGGRSGSQRRLIREALAMARLSHPNVVPIYEIGEQVDSTFIVMEFVDGQTLRSWQETPRTQDEVLAVYKAAGRGLSAAHQKRLVHRDFKPDNVMVGDDGCVRVMDFQRAVVLPQQDRPGGPQHRCRFPARPGYPWVQHGTSTTVAPSRRPRRAMPTGASASTFLTPRAEAPTLDSSDRWWRFPSGVVR